MEVLQLALMLAGDPEQRLSWLKVEEIQAKVVTVRYAIDHGGSKEVGRALAVCRPPHPCRGWEASGAKQGVQHVRLYRFPHRCAGEGSGMIRAKLPVFAFPTPRHPRTSLPSSLLLFRVWPRTVQR